MSGYSNGGASLVKKTLKAYLPEHYSAKSDIEHPLQTLRARAADLVLNSPIGAAAVQTETTNVIGAGLKVFPRIRADVLDLTAEEARNWSRRTKQEFELWSGSAYGCDYLRRNNFDELQHVAFSSYLMDGDAFCVFKRRVPTASNPYSLRLQMIEGLRVSNPLGGGLVDSLIETLAPNGNRIINGIEVDKEGVAIAIWISNRVWNEPNHLDAELKWIRVPFYGDETGCRNVLHVCHDTRPDQYRGVPLLAPVIETIKQISRYGDAELGSAIVKSFFSVFFIRPAAVRATKSVLDEGNDEYDEQGKVEYKAGGATVTDLPPGVDVKVIDSAGAQSTFEPFVKSFLKMVGAAVNLPFEVLLKHFTASYSASRAALLQAADEFRQRKAWFVNDFCRPVYEEFLAEAVALGRINAPGFFDDPLKKLAWSRADWYNESSHMLDVVKEIEGARKRIELGLSTHEKEAAELAGVDYTDNLEKLTQERRLLDDFATNAQRGRGDGDLS